MQTPVPGIEWIAVDWGTTHLRAWAVQGGTVLARAQSDDGMGRLGRDGFEPALSRLVGGWAAGPVTVVACGMVGSRQGWTEAPYVAVPCPPLPQGLTRAPTTLPDLNVHIIPGLKQTAPADVMRGEETQIAGFLALNPGWDGVLCHPGTHCKWAHVSAGEVVSFQTFMTGELFATLAGQTVLRHSVAASGWDEDGFAQGLDEGFSRPERLAARFFALRAEALLNDLSPQVARARLSGLLIGAELAAAKPYWLGQNVAVIGEGAVAGLYVRALAAHSVHATQAVGEAVTLAGLTAAWRRLKG
ncbi:MAG: 2-keto-3-deoxy-galactonokinase [Limimaricola sp.]|uniref:2-dehydro-3-deoxygalactonokinase n=1 Tax=Limimaricola sp. TaxID=2211665 RepID=UPI001D58A459|nr:2-dehydro-3-deoxygalactonokinase [Limimaricola sp.]MBI1417538.1 2-keto-3-deoxy-galactonokinase [Limimaricola sp.]